MALEKRVVTPRAGLVQQLTHHIMRVRIGRELLFRIVLGKDAALKAIIRADGAHDRRAVGVFKAQSALDRSQRAALMQYPKAPFEFYAVIGHLAGHDDIVALDMNLAAL